MSAFLVVALLLATRFDEALERADALAARARAAADAAKPALVDEALAAYDAALRLKAKDLKLAPRVRRRKASLLKHAGRPKEALAEYDRIVAGRARRKDRARALYDGARLLERAGDLGGAETRLARAIEEYGDDIRTRAKAALMRGRLLEAMARPKEAERSYRHVVERCRDQVKACIAAYDALALMALRNGDRRQARRWLRRCLTRYEKRATRSDRYGAYVSRLLGAMKAPQGLARSQG